MADDTVIIDVTVRRMISEINDYLESHRFVRVTALPVFDVAHDDVMRATVFTWSIPTS